MEKIYIAYGILKEIVTVIMILYRNTKSMTRSPDGDTEFFHILAGVLQGDTLAPFLFVICLDYVLRISVDKCNEYGLTLELARSRRFHTEKTQTMPTILQYRLIIHIMLKNYCIFLKNQQLLLVYMLMQPKLNICATIRTVQ